MNHSRAFTLLELAIVLVVVSLMVGFGLQAFQTNNSAECYEKTEAQIKTIDRALQDFIAANNRLPKPAYLTLGSSNPDFGYEASEGVSPDAATYYNRVPAGTDHNGGEVITSAMANSGGVLIGALPHATLGLSVDFASDCWGTKFTYAVTNAMTSSNASNGYPSGAAGTITVNTNSPTAPTTLSTTAAYVVVSHGQDKDGGTPLSASDIAAGSCTASTTKIDRQNCNTTDKIYYEMQRQISTSGDYFDDVVIHAERAKISACPSGVAVTWLTNCAGSTATSIANGGSTTVIHTGSASYAGTTTVTCNDGVVTTGAPQDCTSSACTGTWTATYSNYDDMGCFSGSNTCGTPGAPSGPCTGTDGDGSGKCMIRTCGGGNWGRTTDRYRCSCVAETCIADGSSSGGVPDNCCNGDPDGDGTCGLPIIPATALTIGDGGCQVSSPAATLGQSFNAVSGTVNGGGSYAGGKWQYVIGPIAWSDAGTAYTTGEYPDNAAINCVQAPCPSGIEISDSCINNQSGGTWTTNRRKSDGQVTSVHHS